MSKRLPKDWGLKTKRRLDGKLDIIQKEDDGRESRVRTTDTSEITEKDIQELHAADREAYPNLQAAVRAQVKNLVGEQKREYTQNPIEDAMRFDDSDWIAAAEPVVQAGLGREGLTFGSTQAYRRGWEFAFGRDN